MKASDVFQLFLHASMVVGLIWGCIWGIKVLYKGLKEEYHEYKKGKE